MKVQIKPTKKQDLAWKAWFDPAIQFLLFGGAASGGKILANEGVILTPFGWKKGLELKVGDLVCDPSGGVQRIIQIKPEVCLPCWRVTFSDGTSTDVAEDHLWFAWRGHDSRKKKGQQVSGIDSGEVVETRELKEWLDRGFHPLIPVTKEVAFNVSSNDRNGLSPYLLGVLIGDGCFSRKENLLISCSEEDREHYKAIFGEDGLSYSQKNGIWFRGKRKKEVQEKLKLYGLFEKYSYEKFIPRAFLFGSVEDRYELARGLMDTDGYSPKEKNGCYYYTTSEQLANDAAHLFRSLGAVVTITSDIGSYKKDGKKKECRRCWNLYIKHPNPDLLFSLKRKQHGITRKRMERRITAVYPTGENIRGRCITVSSKEGLYITNDFIVTHNSFCFCSILLVQAYTHPGSKSFIGRNELKRLMQSTYVTWLKVCKYHNIPADDWHLDGKYNYIEFKNGSRIDLLDLAYQPSDPMYERLGSLEYTNGWIEEAGEVKFMAFDVLKSRVGRHKNAEFGLTGKIALTCNPKKGWLYELFYRPWQKGELPANYTFIQSLWSDNPYTRDEAGKMLGQIQDVATRKRLMDGDWDYDDDPSVMIPYQAILDMFENTVEASSRKFLTCDVARFGSDRIVYHFWEGLKDYHQEERTKQGVDVTAQDIRTLAREHQIPWGNILIDEDGVGGGVVDLLPGSKGFIANAAPLPEGGKVPNYQNLKSQCAYKMADLINDRKVSVVCEDRVRRERIEDDLSWIRTWNADKDGRMQILPKDKVKEQLGRSPDDGDAIIMRAWFELQRTGKEPDGLPTTRFAKAR